MRAPVPPRPAEAAAPAAPVERPFRARRLGARPEELDLDCAVRDRAAAVTRVLAACLEDAGGRPLPAELIREASLAWRLQGLLAVAAATRGHELDAGGTCPREGCGEPLEFTLDLRNFSQGDPPSRVEWMEDGVRIAARLPTGLDQERWAQEPPSGWEAMAADLIETMEGPDVPGARSLTPARLQALAERLESADPLTGLRVETPCPRCGETSALDLDLEALLLGALAGEQRSLLRNVHALAQAYHWSEADILALSPARRAKYLRLVAES